jgi:phosphatidylserine/phosphatidylglycerophosphate/cardiolipin synthase-like enzyme
MPRGGELVLCSGYIYEPDRGYSILDDQLLNAIVRGTAGYRVQTLAGKLQQSGTLDWLGYYRNFVATLRDAGVQIEPHIAPERNWHAKVAVRFDTTGQPRAAIVGSSNLTGPAYGERRRTWNYECDVTIWTADPTLDQHFRKDNGDPYEQILVELAAGVRQPTEGERIKVLLEHIHRDREEFVSLDDYHQE